MLPVVAGDRRVATEVIGYSRGDGRQLARPRPARRDDLGVHRRRRRRSAPGSSPRACGLYRRAQHPGVVKLGEMKLFHLSITYLTLLFLAVAVDPFLPF